MPYWLVFSHFNISFGNAIMLKNWYKLSDKIRFAVIGCLNALICYLIYAFFVCILGNDYYQIALALAWGISSITSFFTHRYFVFNLIGFLFVLASDSPYEEGDIGCHRKQEAYHLKFRLHQHIVYTVIGDRR